MQRLTSAAVEHVVAEHRCSELLIPSSFVASVERSWLAKEASLYGRFDLAYDGHQPPKLLEYNADTPTSLLEAAVAQWQWLEETGRPHQFNSLHEKLIERWRAIAALWPQSSPLHLSCAKDSDEDRITVEYLRDTALQAGLEASFVYVEDIGWNGASFVDDDGTRLHAWFELYPWEWLMREPFAPHVATATPCSLEPPWKALLSNKGILAVLWELFPNHPNLFPAYRCPDYLGASFIKKPLLSREGANISIIDRSGDTQTDGPYGAEGFVYQARAAIPQLDGHYPVIGSWVVGDEPAGIGIREDATPITTNMSRFVPHYFD